MGGSEVRSSLLSSQDHSMSYMLSPRARVSQFRVSVDKATSISLNTVSTHLSHIPPYRTLGADTGQTCEDLDHG